MENFEVVNLETVRNAVNICTMCGFCKSVCPSFKAIGWDSALSRGRIVLTYGLLNGEIPADESVVENMLVTEDGDGIRILIALCAVDANAHIDGMAAVLELFGDDDRSEEVLEAKTGEEIYRIFTSLDEQD